MAVTDTKTGFRLPWSSDRSHGESTTDAPTEAAADAAVEPVAGDAAWPDNSDLDTRLGQTPNQPRSVVAQDLAEPAPQEPAMIELETAPTPAPAAPRKSTKLMADLATAIRATAEAARDHALVQVDADVAAVVDEIRSRSKDGEAELRQQADQDIVGIRDWSKAEIARIKEETERRIDARKTGLGDELTTHAADIDRRVGEIQGLGETYHAEMTAYFERLGSEQDPARLATMAESMPEPPVLAPWGDNDAETAEADVVADAATDANVADWAVETAHAAVETDETIGVDETLAFAAAAFVADEFAADEADEASALVDVEPEAVVDTAPAKPAATPWSSEDHWGPSPGTSPEDSADDITGESPDDLPVGDADFSEAVDRSAILAALEAAAEAVVAAESAAESADQAEAAADVAETAAGLLVGRGGTDEHVDQADPDAQAAFAARVDAGGFDTESFADRLAALLPGHVDATEGAETRTTQVVVSGLVSVASIASFKRHLGRLAGVQAVTVSSGPDGEFVFNVTHRADVAFRDSIPSMPGFAARVTGTGNGVVAVTARDPETEG